MDAMENNPRLRVAPVPVEVQGRRMLMFQDPDRITEEAVLMPVEAAAIIQFFDGAHSVRQIQEEIMRASGQLIDTELIQDIVDQLDERLLLESPRFIAHLKKLNDDWSAVEARPAYHAGRGYPEQKKELSSFLESFYAAPEGPGELPSKPRSNDLKAIIAPHMDISASGTVIAHAFKALAERTEAGLFVIFGTGHMEPQRMFVLSDKDYETPLGRVRTDRDLVDRIQKLRKNRNPMDDYIHKQEHSIEFMVLFLQHALGDRREIRIVPVLAAGMSANVLTGAPPSADPAFRDFMDALDKAMAERGEPVCFIAGADLAHLGPRYGDKETWAPIRMAEEEELDRGMLAPVLAGDKDGFFNEIAKIKDRRRICGLPPIYAAMEAGKAQSGEFLKWAYWHDDSTHSAVTFASIALY
jgi:AmmeMemoRadiSam system protein B